MRNVGYGTCLHPGGVGGFQFTTRMTLCTGLSQTPEIENGDSSHCHFLPQHKLADRLDYVDHSHMYTDGQASRVHEILTIWNFRVITRR